MLSKHISKNVSNRVLFYLEATVENAGKGKPSPSRHVLSIENKYANSKNRSTKPKRNDPRNATERPSASRRGKNRKR